MKVGLLRKVPIRELCRVLEQAAKEQGGTFRAEKSRVGGRKVLMLKSVPQEEMRGGQILISPEVRLPFSYQEHFLQVHNVCIEFRDGNPVLETSHYYYGASPGYGILKEGADYQEIEVTVSCLEGELTSFAKKLRSLLLYIPLAGWSAFLFLCLFSDRGLGVFDRKRYIEALPKEVQKEVNVVYMQYLCRVAELLKASDSMLLDSDNEKGGKG